MKILAIGAHFDDVELGCGGSLLAWKAQGHELTIFVATRSGYQDPSGQIVRSDDTARAEGRAAAQTIGAELIEGGLPTFELEFAEPLNARLVDVFSNVRPDLVLTHWGGDVHHDHRALALATLHAGRHVPRLLTYCSNWYQGDTTFEPRIFVDITGTLEAKRKLVQMHQSETKRTGHRWDDFVCSQARLIGLKVGLSAAEGFGVVRWLL